MTRISRLLLDWYARAGRSHLPWREGRDPYRVLVSEFMLQQTQVDRVVPKFEAFIARFGSFEALATSSTADVLRMWKGLGYNSRAVRLREICVAVVERFGGRLPRDEASLRSLRGVGPYTAAAIRTFAFDEDVAAIDTNVRRVVHRLLHGIEHPPAVGAAELDAQARALVPRGRAHDWNSAMMDLGATICTARAPKCLVCPLRAACAAAPLDAPTLDRARVRHARKRAPQDAIPFERTTRFARGRIIDRLRELSPGERISLLDLHRDLCGTLERTAPEIGDLVSALEGDGLVEVRGGKVALRD